jgi:hypothetical protein
MENTYLEQLKRKPIPKMEKEAIIIIENGAIDVNVPPKDTQLKDVNADIGEEDIDDNEDNDDKAIRKNKPAFEIIDKRHENTIDRELILKRLGQRHVFNQETLVDEILPEEPTEPVKIKIKKKKKVIIVGDQTPAILEEEEGVTKIIVKRKGVKPKNVSRMPINNFKIGTRSINDRMPVHKDKIIHKSSTYYMNNRKISIDKLNKLFQPYATEMENNIGSISCDSKNVDFDLLTHQKVVRDYLNLYTPYRGLLLYHGLGSGKTCSSIAIAEGMKSDKRIVLMTPASLKMNFFSELKKCGDLLYRKNQFWEFISTIGRPDYAEALSSALGISKEFIEKHSGAWMVDIKQPSNYTGLTANEQTTLDEQLNEMIRNKYIDINYNGLNMNKVNDLTDNQTKNPFNNAVIIIDEAHNFVSRIVNKINKPGTISYIMYDLLMRAENAKVVLLTGTPIINYPNEIGILYNMLRGYIKTWKLPLVVKTSKKVNRDEILKMFSDENFKTHDFVEYSGNELTITRNPFGFVNSETQKYARRNVTPPKDKRYGGSNLNVTKKNSIVITGGDKTAFEQYNGVKLDDTGNITDHDFISTVTRILKKNEIDVRENGIQLELNKSLPDDKDSFISMFIDTDSATVKNANLFKRRILGLTSYFRSAQEKLLPSFVTNEDGGNFHLITSEMSDYQFNLYEKIRKVEAEQAKQQAANKKPKPGQDLFEIASTYRIFSRAVCNFAFPDPPGRPMPDKKGDEVNESEMDAVPAELVRQSDDYANVDDAEPDDAIDYNKRIQLALQHLSDKPREFLIPSALEQYSPKFLQVLERLTDPENIGLHLIYSQFRTIEGIGLLKIILEANGFIQLKVKKTSTSGWTIENPLDKKPRFLLYTGTETAEEKELMRNIYNSQWEFVPTELREELEKISPNNFMGEIVKIMMITSSGAEGINLRNTRYVHIIEPYWHMVRLEQVVGRARRICSHQDLPEELRTVQVFLYMATLSEKQSTDNNNKELIIRDVSKLDQKTPITTDEALYETSRIKDNINQQLLTSVKESAMDCGIYSKGSKENLVCYGYGKVSSNQFGSYPSLEIDQHQKDDINVKQQTVRLIKITVQGKEYAYDQPNNIVYDMDSYKRSKKTGETLVALGKLEKKGRTNFIVKE